MNIAFCYNVKHNLNYSTDANQDDIEFDSIDVIEGIERAIKELGHLVIRIEADLNAYEKLKANKDKIDLVFNIAEGLGGDAREAQIPLFCEMLGIKYTHSSPSTHSLKLKKHITNKFLRAEGVLTPRSTIVTKEMLSKLDIDGILQIFLNYSNNNKKSANDVFPLFVKPNQQGSSKGVFNDSVVKDKASLEQMIRKVLAEYDTEAIIEEYIDGREFTVAMLADPISQVPQILPVIEQKFDFLPKGFNKVAGYELKWLYEDKLPNPFDGVVCPAKIDEPLKNAIHEACKRVWSLLEVKDCARLDFRYMDQKLEGDSTVPSIGPKDRLYFIEINTLPGINPDPNFVSYFPYAAKVAGLEFKEVINRIIKSAAVRYGI